MMSMEVPLQHQSHQTSTTHSRTGCDLLFAVCGWQAEWQLSLWMRWRGTRRGGTEVISCDRRGWKSLSLLRLHAPLSVHISGREREGCYDVEGRGGGFISRLRRWFMRGELCKSWQRNLKWFKWRVCYKLLWTDMYSWINCHFKF